MKYESGSRTDGYAFEVENDETSLIFTTVPAQGMTCYVDGEETWFETVDGYLAAVRVGVGKHTVEFRYRVKGLGAGVAVSAVSAGALAAYALYLALKKKKKRSLELDGIEIR